MDAEKNFKIINNMNLFFKALLFLLPVYIFIYVTLEMNLANL